VHGAVPQQNLCRPDGALSLIPKFPALACWATLCRLSEAPIAKNAGQAARCFVACARLHSDEVRDMLSTNEDFTGKCCPNFQGLLFMQAAEVFSERRREKCES